MMAGVTRDRLSRLSAEQRMALYGLLIDRGVSPVEKESASDTLTAFVSGSSIDDRIIKQQLAPVLPDYMIPSRIEAMTSMPLTANGKVDRLALAASIRPTEPRIDALPSLTPQSEKISAIWATLLNRTDVDPNVNFFELGGHSLMVLECVRMINDACGSEVTPSQFFNNPTIAELARLLEEKKASEESKTLYSLGKGKGHVPVFFIYAPAMARLLLQSQAPIGECYGLRKLRRHLSGPNHDYASVEALSREMLAEIMNACPSGEMVICGSSFGAMLAYEVAQQMAASGRPPLRLILIDPTPPRSDQVSATSTLQSIGRSTSDHIQYILLNNPFRSLFWRKLYDLLVRNRQRQRLVEETQKKLANQEILTSSQAAAYDQDLFDALWKDYQPRPYEGEVSLFYAEDDLLNSAQGWDGYLPETARVHRIEGNHTTLFDAESSQTLVRLFLADIQA